MGTLTNSRGQVLTRSFLLGTEGPFGLTPPAGMPGASVDVITDVYGWLRGIGLTADAINPGAVEVPDTATSLVATSVAESVNHMELIQQAAVDSAHDRTASWVKRKEAWESSGQSSSTRRLALRTQELIKEDEELLRSMTPERSLIRPLIVVLPRKA